MAKYELDADNKIYAYVRMATGEDEKYIFAIRAKLESALPERGTDSDELVLQDSFAACMRCTERIEGMKFPLCTGNESNEKLASVYLAWIKLPRRLLRIWRNAPDTLDENFNASDLLPPDMVSEDVLKSPLPSGAGARKE